MATGAATPTDFRPIFIVGCERSGTTLLASLFDRHSQVAAPPETQLFYDATLAALARAAGGTHAELMDTLLAQPRMADLQLDRGRVLARFEAHPAQVAWLYRAALEEYASSRGKPLVVEKTPQHLLHVAVIRRFFPQARFICIVRDGRDVVLSLMKTGWTHKNPWLHGTMWRQQVELGLRLEQQHPDCFVRVHYEALLREPEHELTRLMRFIGLEFEPGQLDAQIETSVVPEWEKAWKGKAQEPLDPTRVAAWKRTANEREVWRMNATMGRQLRRFDYPDTSLDGCPPLTKLQYSLTGALYGIAFFRRLHALAARAKKRFAAGSAVR